MESSESKTIVYVMIVLMVILLFGVAMMKFIGASASDVDTRTGEQKLHDLEKSPGITSPQARNFVDNEQQRQQATKDMERDVLGAPSGTR